MQRGMQGYETADEIYTVGRVYALVTVVTYFILIWDWLANLSGEVQLVHRSKSAFFFSLKLFFLISRYLTLVWCTFVIITWSIVVSGHDVSLCSWFTYYPYGYSVISLAAHAVMVFRLHSIYERSKSMLWIMGTLAGVDFAIQMSANHFARAVLLQTSSPNIDVCFVAPTSTAYALVFISPTIFHHLVLVLTLFKSITHLRITRSTGLRSIMETIQRDHILYTLAICLINFSNLVLVVARDASWPYRLINQLPAAAFTQIFLSRIVFSLRRTLRNRALNTSPCLEASSFTGGGSPASPMGELACQKGQHDSGFTKSPFITQLRLARHNKEESTYQIDSAASTPTFVMTPRRFAFWSKESRGRVSESDDTKMTNAFGRTLSRGSQSQRTGERRESIPISTLPFSKHSTPGSPNDREDVTEFTLPMPEELASHQPQVAGAGEVAARPMPHPLQGLGIPGSSPEDGTLGSYHSQSGARKLSLDDVKQESGVNGIEEPEILPIPTTDGTPERRNTIDLDQSQCDWSVPAVWYSTPSPRASPLPYSEHRLSRSLSQTSRPSSPPPEAINGAGKRMSTSSSKYRPSLSSFKH